MLMMRNTFLRLSGCVLMMRFIASVCIDIRIAKEIQR